MERTQQEEEKCIQERNGLGAAGRGKAKEDSGFCLDPQAPAPL